MSDAGEVVYGQTAQGTIARTRKDSPQIQINFRTQDAEINLEPATRLADDVNAS